MTLEVISVNERLLGSPLGERARVNVERKLR